MPCANAYSWSTALPACFVASCSSPEGSRHLASLGLSGRCPARCGLCGLLPQIHLQGPKLRTTPLAKTYRDRTGKRETGSRGEEWVEKPNGGAEALPCETLVSFTSCAALRNQDKNTWENACDCVQHSQLSARVKWYCSD